MAPVAADVFARASSLNPFMALGRESWAEARDTLTRLLSSAGASDSLQRQPQLRARALVPRAHVRLHVPAHVGDYSDFYCSRDHAANVGAMFRGRDAALAPNWSSMPIAYHGRASSVVVSGTDVRRPRGQVRDAATGAVALAPSAKLDLELEVGFFVGGPENALGQPVPVAAAADRVFGVVLLNDWSARDVQQWEYVPLGPFTSKNFGTSVSAWVVPLQALAPFRVPAPPQSPPPLPYLRHERDFALDVALAVHVNGCCVSRSNLRHVYWTAAQQVAHHSVTGCNLRPGDLLATGTVSGPDRRTQAGCLLEATWNGSEPVLLTDGSRRTFLEDGDEVRLSGRAADGHVVVSLGECVGRVLPPLAHH